MSKKKVCAFSAFDDNNEKYFNMLKKSLRKFHTEEELPLFMWNQQKIEKRKDPMFFYRQKPIIARELLKEYDLVIGLDADQIITGRLDHIIDDTTYDIAAPLNWNRVDPQIYGLVTVADIPPVAYLNCGVVAMRNREFVEKWFRLCFGYHFNSYKYKEQDLLNIMASYFDWNVKNLDSGNTWNGLISKGEWGKLEIKDNKLICPPQADHFPDQEMEVKILHWGGGNDQNKMNFHVDFKPEVETWLEELVK